ncbi:MAG: hypothetical protein L6R48_02800 [Planctomycetes bacterium]|nr:hypothetical protein [Planctomycetota bacterium]
MGALLIAGSTALILFAIRFLRKGVDRLLATRLGALPLLLAASPGRAFAAGALMAAAAPSSSGMAAVAARLALEERVPPAAALALMLGANVGLTSLVLLGAAGLDAWYALPLVAGVGLFQFTRGDLSRGVGQALLAIALVLLGVHLAKQAVPALHGGDLDALLAIAAHRPPVLALAAALLTVALQSSSLTILLLVCLAADRPFALDATVAVVGGANLGLAATTLAVGWRDRRSRLPALALCVLKGATSAAAIALAMAAAPDGPVAPGSAGTAHLAIALAVAAVGLVAGRPLLAALARSPLCAAPVGAAAGPRYLGLEVGGDARLALANSRREILHVAERARAMLEQVWQAWQRGDRLLAKGVARLDDQIDDLDRDIKAYLARCGDRDDDRHERLLQLRYVTQIEAIGDLIEKQLAGLVVKGARHAAAMPADCRLRLDATCQQVLRTLLAAETAFACRDRDLAARLLAAKAELGALVRGERDRTLARLRDGVPHQSEAIYLDLIDGLARIAGCACAVGYDVLDDGPDQDSTPVRSLAS